MAKAVFFSIPAFGHINPTLPIVRQLVKDGDRVYYYSTKNFQNLIEEAGAVFREYRHFDGFDLDLAGKNIGYLYYLLTDFTQKSIASLLRETRELDADYIIHDALALYGRIVAGVLNLPAISSITTLVFVPGTYSFKKTISFLSSVGFTGLRCIAKAKKLKKQLCREYSLEEYHFLDAFTNEENLNFVYTSSLFQPKTEELELEKYRFIGPSLLMKPPVKLFVEDSDLPVVYISLGTIWNNTEELKKILQSLKGMDCRFIIAGVKNGEIESTDKILVLDYADQLNVLQHCNVFITHGGMNSVNEAMYCEVPMILYPFQAEQREVAQRVENLKCGIILKKLAAESLNEAIQSILNNPSFKNNCRILSRSLKEAGGYMEACRQIREYISQSIQ